MKTIINQQNSYCFYLRDYKNPVNLSHAIGAVGITRYIYAFVHLFANTDSFGLSSEIIKYGKGADLEWQKGAWGNRVYRQAGHIPGWDSMLNGPNGSEMFTEYLPAYQARYNRSVHKNDVTVMIWDFTTYKFPSESQFDVTLRQFEDFFIEEYKRSHNGISPVGNVNRAIIPNQSVVADVIFDTLFKIV
jgi:hypothetical protein